MPEEQKDLCCICEANLHCAHRGQPKMPKLHCEAFDVGVQSSVLREKSALKVAAPVAVGAGLCCNCLNRLDCTIQIPEGEIWHCEEYR